MKNPNIKPSNHGMMAYKKAINILHGLISNFSEFNKTIFRDAKEEKEIKVRIYIVLDIFG